jgi:seryl-tRNA synthetase
LHRKDWIDVKELPIKYAGVSSCFRKEAGAHGKETWGVFRVHQFEKVEQFVLCKPEESWEMLEKMVAVSEEYLQSLELPYRVINIVSGALNDAAAKKYDIEAWFPGYGEYKELVSCSNCTDYQSRALEVRCGSKTKGDVEKKYVHMLNGTLCATQRTMTCILENCQEPNGIRVPKVLVIFTFLIVRFLSLAKILLNTPNLSPRRLTSNE